MYSKTQIKKPGWNPKGGEREVQQEFVVCGQSLRCLRGSPCPKHTLSHHTVMTKRVTKQCVLCSALLTQSAPPPTPPISLILPPSVFLCCQPLLAGHKAVILLAKEILTCSHKAYRNKFTLSHWHILEEVEIIIR